MAIFIKDYALCFHTKTLCLTLFGFLKPLKPPIYLWTNIFIDYVIDLPKCLRNGKIYKYIFIAIDCLTKMRHFILIINLDIEEFIKAFTYIVYKLHSALNIIIFDKGFSFTSNLWRHLNQRLKITLSLNST